MAEGKNLQQLSLLNSKINGMSEMEVRKQLAQHQLCDQGHIDVLKLRLKRHVKKDFAHLIKEKQRTMPEFICVLDFEATCEKDVREFPHEIIEMPIVLVNTATKAVVDVFQSHVRPVLNPVLSAFCTELTGITQATVDAADDFPTVLSRVEAWLSSHGLFTDHTCAFATDGPWDFRDFFSIQCSISGIKRPAWSREWINIRRLFGSVYTQHGNLEKMLATLGMTFEGRPHCGLDDTRNLARIVCQMLSDEIVIPVNDRLDAYDTGSFARFRDHTAHRVPSLQRPTDPAAAGPA
eukprot:m.21276 g.21276  ORF g.21276 m.21276 type:complete len:293 (+) comp8047_c0_seq1:170-1048(+)